MESPLSKKIDRLEATLAPTWRDLAAFLLALDGYAARPQDIVAEYIPGETVQPRTQAEIRKINVEAGLPLDNVLRDEGWTDQELADMEADRAAEQANTATYAAATLEAARSSFDAGAPA
jgi:hypothetical protein